jgi:hypothetical protein
MERKNLPQKWEKLSQISKKLKNKNKNYLKIILFKFRCQII